MTIQEDMPGNSLEIQWLALHDATAGLVGLIPGQGTKILVSFMAQPKKKAGLLTTKPKPSRLAEQSNHAAWDMPSQNKTVVA